MIRFSATRPLPLLFLATGLGGALLLTSPPRGLPAAAANIPHRARSAAIPAPKTAPKTAPPKHAPPRGDAFLRGHLDLGRARVRHGRYEISLEGGRRAVLTLDPRIQREAERVLARAKAPMGAIVVMATDGRLLALAGRRHSAPSKSAHELALSTWAPAASIFKIVTATALMEAGVRPNHKVCFHGGFRSVVKSNLSDSRRDRRCEDLAFGFARSQNAIFAKLAHRHLQPDALRDTARSLGFDAAPHFALEADASSCDIPEAPLPFARVSAGFWHSKLSCLGGALLANTVAAGGLKVTPRIVDRIIDRSGKVTQIAPIAPTRAMTAKVAAALGKVMVGTTEAGTARKAFKDRRGRRFLGELSVAGKTGTLSRRTGSYLQYSWFVGFAPAAAPEISISVLLGNPQRWHLKAHTAARLVLSKAFSGRRSRKK